MGSDIHVVRKRGSDAPERNGSNGGISTPSDQAGERRHVLRRLTANEHATIEAKIGRFGTREAYVRYLSAIYSFRTGFEGGLCDACTRHGLDLQPTLLSGVLERDLFDLGVPVPANTLTVRPVASTEALFGILYVLEGSALGSRLLIKDARALGFHEGFGARHLALQSGSLQSWHAYLKRLEAHTDCNLYEIAAAAAMTFTLAVRAFDEVSH